MRERESHMTFVAMGTNKLCVLEFIGSPLGSHSERFTVNSGRAQRDETMTMSTHTHARARSEAIIGVVVYVYVCMRIFRDYLEINAGGVRAVSGCCWWCMA